MNYLIMTVHIILHSTQVFACVSLSMVNIKQLLKEVEILMFSGIENSLDDFIIGHCHICHYKLSSFDHTTNLFFFNGRVNISELKHVTC